MNTSPILDSRPEFISLWKKAVEIAESNMEKPKETWKRQLTCMPGQGTIWQWDSCFMALYAGYTPDSLNGLGNLDNLYSMQREDGYIGMAYNIEKEVFLWGERINPPLYAWAEWTYAERTGDTSRLARVFPVIKKLFYWTKGNRRRANGLYWFEDTGSSGMDNSPRAGRIGLDGSHVCWVDLSSQQVLSARMLAKIASAIGLNDDAGLFVREAEELSALINEKMWSERTRIYHDIFEGEDNLIAQKTAAAFWPILAGVATGERLGKLASHLTDSRTFGASHPVPTLSRDDPNFNPHGGYWLGGVWAPVNYMIVRGLADAGMHDLAREIALKHLKAMAEILSSTEYASIWECYSPDFMTPSDLGKYREDGKRGKIVRDNFVGWSGLGPFVMLPENIIGLDINALEKRIVWRIGEAGRQGMREIPFNGGYVSLEIDVKENGEFSGTVESNRPFTLHIRQHDRISSTFEINGTRTIASR